MAGKTTAQANVELNALFGSGSPASFTLKLFTTIPTKAAAGTSPVSLWTNYADLTITNNATNFPTATTGVKTYSGATLDFGTATVPGAQPTVVGWGLFNNTTMIYFGIIGATDEMLFTATVSDVFTCASHNLTNGQCVVLKAAPNVSLPTGVSADTLYYVVGVSGDTFQLSTTSGGSAINLTSAGSGYFQVCSPQTIANGSGVTLANGAIVITEG